MKVDKIQCLEPFDELFPINPLTLKAIQDHMTENGYDESQPVTIWKENSCLVDGYTRLQAAKNCNITDIPVFERSFKSETDALKYAVHNQRDRRNLKDSDIMKLVEQLATRLQKRGRKSEQTKLDERDLTTPTIQETSEILGVPYAKIAQAVKILNDDDDSEEQQKILDGEKSIHSAYVDTKKKELDEQTVAPTKNFLISLPKGIEYVGWALNPIVGCDKETVCPNCHAMNPVVNTYGNFKYRFFPNRLEALSRTEAPKFNIPRDRNILLCSAGDMMGDWVPSETIELIIKAVRNNPQWNCLVYTRFPKRYLQFKFPVNMWLGATVTCQDEAVQAEAVFKKLSNVTKFMYCNPLESKVIFSSLKSVSWVLIGNGDRNEQPEWTWVENIIIQSRMDGCQVYLSPEIKVRPREIPIPTVTS